MNREEALTLLRRGPEGVAVGPRRRGHGEATPDLHGVYLQEAYLAGANVESTDLIDAPHWRFARWHGKAFDKAFAKLWKGLTIWYEPKQDEPAA